MLALKTQIATTKGIATLGKLGTTIGILLWVAVVLSTGLAVVGDSSLSALTCLISAILKCTVIKNSKIFLFGTLNEIKLVTYGDDEGS